MMFDAVGFGCLRVRARTFLLVVVPFPLPVYIIPSLYKPSGSLEIITIVASRNN